MKRYTELTHEELIVLDDTQIQQLIDLEIAHKAIEPVPCPVLPSLEKVGIIADDKVFCIHGLMVRNKEVADAIADMEILITDYSYDDAGYDYKWLKPETSNQISKKSFYKQEDVLRVSAALQEDRIKRDKYKDDKIEYDGYIKATSNIRNKVWQAISNANEFEYKLKLARETYKKYLELADNDEAVAKTFFRNTYKGKPEFIEKVLGEKPVEEAKEAEE